MVPGSIQQRLSRYEVSIDVAHFRLSERLGPKFHFVSRSYANHT